MGWNMNCQGVTTQRWKIETRFGQRLAGGRSEVKVERRLERNRNVTPPPTADGSGRGCVLGFRARDERAGNDEGGPERY